MEYFVHHGRLKLLMNALLVRRKFIKVLVAKIENIMLRNSKMSFSRVSLPLARHIVGSRPDGVKPKTVKLVFVFSPLVDSESGYFLRWGRQVCPRTVVSVSQHHTNQTKCVGLVQGGYHHNLIKNYSRHDIGEKLLRLTLTLN